MFGLSSYHQKILWLPLDGENPFKETRFGKIARYLKSTFSKTKFFWTVIQKNGQTNDLKKQLLLCLLIFSIAVWFLFQTELEEHRTFFIPRNYDFRSGGYLISGKGCHIPALDQYDPSIAEALDEVEPPPNCDENSTGILVKSNLTHLFIDPLVQKKLNLTNNLTCCVRPFWRPFYNDRTDYRYYHECFPFKKVIKVDEVEFVRVECRVNNELKNKDFYSFIPNSFRAKANRYSLRKNISVLILGIDALSRLNFRRQMTLTHDFLFSGLKAIEFFGFHKVGDNTFPNLMPVLAGKSEEELITSCWPNEKKTFDNCSFIWDEYKKAGFMTAFGEDASWMGLFEYCKMGFRKKPTDVYLRTFNLVYENELGHDKRLNANICVGPKLNIEVLLDSVKKFVLRLRGKRSFGFFWENSLSHDFLNLPKYGDRIHVNLLEEFLKNNIFDQSAVFILSDHGIRWGTIRSTYQGYVEERLPLLMLSCPEWFKKRFPLAWANVRKNSLRLTTPFDLHETLKDFKDLSLLGDKNIIKRSKLLKVKNKGKLPRGISLFLPIPSERSCKDADITDHWCTCYKDESVSTNDTYVLKSANFVIDHINSLLKGHRQCSELNLKAITSARLKVLPSDGAAQEVSNYNERTKDYTLMLQVEPGEGKFEATVKHVPQSDTFTLVGPISRSNSYGNSSYCVSHYKLKLYCYCIT